MMRSFYPLTLGCCSEKVNQWPDGQAQAEGKPCLEAALSGLIKFNLQEIQKTG